MNGELNLSSTHKTKLTKEEIVRILKEVLEKEKNVQFALLFGSYARGDYFPFSDVDVAVYLKEYKPNDLRYEAKLEQKLMSHLKTDNVDLVIPNEAPPALKYEIVTEGELLFTRNFDDFCFYYSYVLREFFDYRYHLKKFFKNAIENLRRKTV